MIFEIVKIVCLDEISLRMSIKLVENKSCVQHNNTINETIATTTHSKFYLVGVQRYQYFNLTEQCKTYLFLHPSYPLQSRPVATRSLYM